MVDFMAVRASLRGLFAMSNRNKAVCAGMSHTFLTLLVALGTTFPAAEVAAQSAPSTPPSATAPGKSEALPPPPLMHPLLRPASPPPRTTTQQRAVDPIGLTEPSPFGWHTDFLGAGRGIFDLSFGVKAWYDKFSLRNLIFGGAVDLLPGVRIRAQIRRHEGERKAFQIDLDETYLEGYDQYRARDFDGAVSLRVGHIRYLHVPYPDAIALFDTVPGINDLYSRAETDYRSVVLEGELAHHNGWGVHWTGRAAGFDEFPPDARILEAYGFYRSDFWRDWHVELRGGDLAVREQPLGQAGQPGVNVYLGKRFGEFNVGLLYEHKQTEHDYTGIAVQFRSGPVTRALGRYTVDYSRRPEGLSAQIPLLHLRLNESRFVRSGDMLVGEVRAVRVRTVWVQGFQRNEYEHRLESWGETRSSRLHCVVVEEPWYLQTEALVSPHLSLDNRWLHDRGGPAQYIQRVTYRYYRPRPHTAPPGTASRTTSEHTG